MYIYIYIYIYITGISISLVSLGCWFSSTSFWVRPATGGVYIQGEYISKFTALDRVGVSPRWLRVADARRVPSLRVQGSGRADAC